MLLLCFVAAAIVIPLTLPYIRVYRTLGIVRSTQELDHWSAPLRSYLTTNEQSVLGKLGNPFAVSSGEWVLFPGVLTTILGLLGLVWKPTRETLFWGMVTLTALILSLGTGVRWERGDPVWPMPLPYGFLYNHLPGFGALRVPSRWGILVTLNLSILAATFLARLVSRWRWRMIAAIVPLLALETIAIPVRTTNPQALTTVPAIYPWLGAPEQADITNVLELPVGPLPRGAEIERITWRMFNSRFHWKKLPVAFSGLIPFGTIDLLTEIQTLPNQQSVQYLQLAGIDTVVIHSNELSTTKVAALEAGLRASPLIRHRADIGEAHVYTVLPSAELLRFEQASDDIFCSSDERAPGFLMLALSRRWQAQGRTVVGQGRLKYYGPLQVPKPGRVWSAGVLAAAEDPRPYGFTPENQVWTNNGLAFYRATPALRANLDLGEHDSKATHPTYPSTTTLTVGPTRLIQNSTTVEWTTPLTMAFLELDLASLSTGSIMIGDQSFQIISGTTTVQTRVQLGQPISLTGIAEQTALLRVRILSAMPPPPSSTPGIAIRAESVVRNTHLHVKAEAGGTGEILLDIWGAAVRDDRPVHLLRVAQPITQAGLDWDVDLAQPAIPQDPPVDGHYIAYLKPADQADTIGFPVATFNMVNGHIDDPHPVPLPLSALR